MTDCVESSDVIGDQEGGFCSRTFWAYRNSGIMTINTIANIQGAITDVSALACCATWKDRVTRNISYLPGNPFRNRLNWLSIWRGRMTRVTRRGTRRVGCGRSRGRARSRPRRGAGRRLARQPQRNNSPYSPPSPWPNLPVHIVLRYVSFGIGVLAS